MKYSEFLNLKSIVEDYVLGYAPEPDSSDDSEEGYQEMKENFKGFEDRLMDGSNIIHERLQTLGEDADKFWKIAENCLVDEWDMPRGADEES